MDLLKNNMGEKVFKKNHPEEYAKIVSFSEKLNKKVDWPALKWLYINDISIVPTCSVCGADVSFFSPARGGYAKTCSLSCAKLDLENQQKTKENNLKKYGTKNPTQSDVVKNKMKATNLEKYGVEYASSNKEIAKKIGIHSKKNWENTSNKIKESNLKKYGVENYFKTTQIRIDIKNSLGVDSASQLPEFQEKIKKTNLERYGVERPAQNEEILKKMQDTCLEKFGVKSIMQHEATKIKNIKKYKKTKRKQTLEKHSEILKVYDTYFICQCNIKNHQYKIHKSLFFQRKRFNVETCTTCNDPNDYRTSFFQKDVQNYIKSIYTGTLVENANKFDKNRPKIEADIYLPQIKIAIECHGIFWHSEIWSKKNKHLLKNKFFEEKDIQLIQIWEDDWKYKRKIWESTLYNIINKTSEKIFARKCEIKKVNSLDSENFLLENHLQGKIRSKHNYGLYFNNELVSLMTFGKLRKALGQKNKDQHFELLRYCNKINTSVIGGASKLLKHFLKIEKVKEIISYANKDWSKGNLYKTLNFKKLEDTKPNYFWVINAKKENRFKYRKDILVSKGFDPNKTEIEIMHEMGYYRVYNSGSQKWVYIND